MGPLFLHVLHSPNSGASLDKDTVLWLACRRYKQNEEANMAQFLIQNPIWLIIGPGLLTLFGGSTAMFFMTRESGLNMKALRRAQDLTDDPYSHPPLGG